MKWLLLASLLVQAAPAQSEADKLEAALKKFGDRTYTRFIDGIEAGYRTLKTSLVTEKGRTVSMLEVSEIESGKTLSTTVEEAELNGLKLKTARRGEVVGGKSELNTITVDGLKATLKYAGKEDKVVAITEDTVGEEGLLRRICATEQKEGAELKLDVLRYPARDIERRTLKCEGLKQLEIRGMKFDAYLWVEPGNLKYWVSPDGYLLRWIAPGGADFVLDAK
jgi:hypothetical protein